MKKSIIVVITVLFVLATATVASANVINNIQIQLNNERLSIPTSMGSPFIDNQSRTMIPLRAVSEGLGHSVSWDARTQTATIDGAVKIRIGDFTVQTASGAVQMDTQAVLINGRTYVPLRFVVEALGYEVAYEGPRGSNGFQHTINIYGGGVQTSLPQTPNVKDDYQQAPADAGLPMKGSRVDYDHYVSRAVPYMDSGLTFDGLETMPTHDRETATVAYIDGQFPFRTIRTDMIRGFGYSFEVLGTHNHMSFLQAGRSILHETHFSGSGDSTAYIISEQDMNKAFTSEQVAFFNWGTRTLYVFNNPLFGTQP